MTALNRTKRTYHHVHSSTRQRLYMVKRALPRVVDTPYARLYLTTPIHPVVSLVRVVPANVPSCRSQSRTHTPDSRERRRCLRGRELPGHHHVSFFAALPRANLIDPRRPTSSAGVQFPVPKKTNESAEVIRSAVLLSNNRNRLLILLFISFSSFVVCSRSSRCI
jgi:hypothetical protein